MGGERYWVCVGMDWPDERDMRGGGREALDLERLIGGGGGDWEFCVGSTDMRSMRSRRRSRSRSAIPPAWDALALSIWLSSWPPSARRLLTKVSTF